MCGFCKEDIGGWRYQLTSADRRIMEKIEFVG